MMLTTMMIMMKIIVEKKIFHLNWVVVLVNLDAKSAIVYQIFSLTSMRMMIMIMIGVTIMIVIIMIMNLT